MTSTRKTSATESQSIVRLRDASPMYAAFTGQIDQWRDLRQSEAMHAELDLLSAWDVEDSDGGQS